VACTNIGLAPTFAEASRRREGPLVEAHLIDYDEQGREALYGAVLDVTFVERIRAEKRFEGIEELREQIARDVHEARRVVGKNA
jgi:riboflavin kinase/FMN adenylyltransferase